MPTISAPSHSKMKGTPKKQKETDNEGHSEENMYPEQAQIPSGLVYHHQPLTGYAMPPSYQYPPLATGSEPPLYYYSPPPPSLPGQYHAMPPGYPYGPPYYPMSPPQGYYYPPVIAPVPNLPKASPPSSAKETKTPISDEKMNKGNKDPLTRNNNMIPTQSSSSTSTDEEFLSNVKPMRSDFFIFASENKEQVLNTLERNSGKSQIQLITELNEKLLNMWENLSSNVRSSYQAKEEEDRIRFMHEDEIESRHCATLTSRVKNAKSKDTERSDTNDDGDSMQEAKSNHKRGINANNTDGSKGKGGEKEGGEETYESPPKKSK